MKNRRVERLNSLLRKVISDVIHSEVHDPGIHKFTSVTSVSITKDLRLAKVHISVLGTPEEQAQTLASLEKAAKFIAVRSSKQIVIRTFPELTFKFDDSVEKTMQIEELLQKIHEKEKEQ